MTILTEHTVGTNYIFGLPKMAVAIFFLVVAAASLWMMSTKFARKHNDATPLCIAIAILAAIAGMVCATAPNARKEIQATVDNTVSFVSLEKYYEFVSKDGAIYTFIVKEGEP